MVELIVNNNKIELSKETSIKYTKQISDIFDIASVACSFTNSFDFDKTPANSQTMQQLGISGDSSLIPYQKNNAALKVDGFDLISNGWFDISPTEENYKGRVIDGMIDFFKAIENKTMGNDLDLSNFNHEKLLSTVIASFTNEYYQYLIADYGGKNLFETGINIDYLAPSFSVRKLWDLIFTTFGFTCDYTNLSYLDGLYITYPKDVSEGQTNELIATLIKNPYNNTNRVNLAGFTYPSPNYFWDSNVITEGALILNWQYVIPETNSYNFDLTIAMYCEYRRVNYYSRQIDVEVAILKNGVLIGKIPSAFIESDTTGEERNTTFNLTCNSGDIIELSIYVPQYLSFRSRSFYAERWKHQKTDFKIYKTDLGTTILENELKDFSIKDFIKEIIWRTGLTPVLNKETNAVNFITLDSRLDFDNAQDYSHCFVKRKSEIYQSDYAQKNTFKLKKNIDTDTTGDGYLYVPNVNLSDEKTLAQSKIYAPDKKIVTSFGAFSTNQYKIWETETKDNDGVIEITYKGLSGRFYFVRKETVIGSFNLVSEKLVDSETVSSLPIAINTDTLFEEAIFKNYSEYQKIFTNFRIHNIDLAMTINDFMGLDLSLPVYLKQENAYYICNKISFEEGEKSTGEFIKINKL
jgi:hypothetical protein